MRAERKSGVSFDILTAPDHRLARRPTHRLSRRLAHQPTWFHRPADGEAAAAPSDSRRELHWSSTAARPVKTRNCAQPQREAWAVRGFRSVRCGLCEDSAA